jgi:hypothetical protein
MRVPFVLFALALLLAAGCSAGPTYSTNPPTGALKLGPPGALPQAPLTTARP